MKKEREVTKNAWLAILAIITGGMLSGCMTVNYPVKGTGEYQDVEKTRKVSAGSITVYNVTIERESLPEDSSVTIPIGGGRSTRIDGPKTVYNAHGGGAIRANPGLSLPATHIEYTDARAAQQAVEIVRSYGGIATMLESQKALSVTERYTVKEEIMVPDYSKPPAAQLKPWDTVYYAFFSGFAAFSFAGMPGATNPKTEEPFSDNYLTCVVTGILCSIPMLIDIYRTMFHKKGKTGLYGPIEYFVYNPLKEMQETE